MPDITKYNGTGRDISLSGIWLFDISKAGEIIHARIQGKSNAPALFKGKIALSTFEFRIVALVDARQMLHFNLSIASLFSKFLESCDDTTSSQRK